MIHEQLSPTDICNRARRAWPLHGTLKPETRIHSSRRKTRCPTHDYSTPASYFVTICSRNHAHLFGAVQDGSMQLSKVGVVVESCWRAMPNHFGSVALDRWIVMPNHLHGIVRIGANRRTAAERRCGALLSTVIGSFKSAVTRHARAQTPGLDPWQRGFHDRIIRDDRELAAARRYIADNPRRWMERQRQGCRGQACLARSYANCPCRN